MSMMAILGLFIRRIYNMMDNLLMTSYNNAFGLNKQVNVDYDKASLHYNST